MDPFPQGNRHTSFFGDPDRFAKNFGPPYAQFFPTWDREYTKKEKILFNVSTIDLVENVVKHFSRCLAKVGVRAVASHCFTRRRRERERKGDSFVFVRSRSFGCQHASPELGHGEGVRDPRGAKKSPVLLAGAEKEDRVSPPPIY